MNTKGIDGNLKTESLQRAAEFVPNEIRCTESRKQFHIQMHILFLATKALKYIQLIYRFYA